MSSRESHKLLIGDYDGNFLLMQRDWYASFNPGGLDFPGGKPELSDLSPRDTAIREAAEETGLAIKPEQCSGRPLVEIHYQDGKDEYWKTAWLALVARLPHQIEFPSTAEHIGSVVLSRDEALRVVRQPFQIEALSRVEVSFA